MDGKIICRTRLDTVFLSYLKDTSELIMKQPTGIFGNRPNAGNVEYYKFLGGYVCFLKLLQEV